MSVLIKSMGLSQTPQGTSKISLVIDVPPKEFAKTCMDIQKGQRYEVSIKKCTKDRSLSQNSAIWAKIGEIANALYANKQEVYEEMLRRYGQPTSMMINENAIVDLRRIYSLVDIVGLNEDGTVYVMAYKGLSQMTTDEASRLLEGCLDECREMGLSTEVKTI